MGVLPEEMLNGTTPADLPTVALEWDREYLIQHHKDLLNHWVTLIYFPIAITANISGTFGNILIIASILYAKELKNVGNMFILNLALTDLVVTCFINTWNILSVWLGKEWFLDRWWVCDGIQIICGCACVGALLNISLVAVNRYIHICRTDLYQKVYTPFNTGAMCVGAWVGAFLTMELPNILGPGGHMFDLKSYNCTIDRLKTYWWTLTRAIVVFGTPMIVTGFCYYKIFAHVQASKKRITAMGGEKKDNDKDAKSKRDSQKLALTLFTVFAAYVIAYTPYTILALFDNNDRMPMPYYFIAYLLVHLSFAINWLLYGVTNKQFRRVYFRLLRVEKCCPSLLSLVETTAASSTSGATASSTAGEKSVIASHA